VDHDRPVLLPVWPDVSEFEALGHGEIHLDRGALPFPFQGILKLHIDFPARKSPLSFVDLVWKP